MSNPLFPLLSAGLFCVVATVQGATAAPPDDAGIVAAIVQQMERPLAPSTGTVRASTAADGSWTVELGSRLLADVRGPQIPAELDARLQAIRLAVMLRREQQGAMPPSLEFRFNGHRLEHYFPSPPARPRAHNPLDEGASGVDVFISASHGWYLHGGTTWYLQRPPTNGMIEDLVTPQLAQKFADALDGKKVRWAFSRSVETALHPLAGKPWWQMAARYHAQALYPDRPDIWQSYADRSTPLREYNDDIRSRPLMANEVGAGVLVHLHTNAADPLATGMMAFHQSGRSEDQRLGHVLLCKMRDAIRQVPAYADYRVRVQPSTGNFGGNRLALAPSILIELGFHTNPQDAAALQDPQFQAAVAEGLREGYDAFQQGGGAGGERVCQ